MDELLNNSNKYQLLNKSGNKLFCYIKDLTSVLYFKKNFSKDVWCSLSQKFLEKFALLLLTRVTSVMIKINSDFLLSQQILIFLHKTPYINDC